jgi:XTP/dITP diphosphohydrolase
MQLILGTHNRKKGVELQQLLAPHGFELKTLAEVSNAIEVVEDGDSFQANAQLKATQQALNLGCWVLGEDSGICVDALGGEPGIYSARFSGEGATDERNNALMLEKLDGVPKAKRTAHYVCHMSLSDPEGNVRVDCEETCRGRILESPRGTGGFGYDPLFEIPEYHATFGELGSAVKAMLSHRSRAMRKFVPKLLKTTRELRG